MNNIDIYTAGTDKLLKPRIKPCRCDRYLFPHRREGKCEELEEEGFDDKFMRECDAFNAEVRKVFS